MSTTAMTGSQHHPTAWYAEMSSLEKNTFWACTAGWMLDAMDVQMFSFAIPAIIAAFAITNADAGLIGTATLLASAFGAGSRARCRIASAAYAPCRLPLRGLRSSLSCVDLLSPTLSFSSCAP
jgi:MFS family permease